MPAILEICRLLWLVPHQLLAAFAVCVTAADASTPGTRAPLPARSGVAGKAVLAGRDLILGTPCWGRRRGAARRVRITERDLRLLALLLDVNFLSISQLVLLGWGPFGVRAGQRRLKLLHDGGYVDRFRSVCGAGSREWNYRIAARGFKELVAARLAPRSPRFVPHAIDNVDDARRDLELTALVLCIALDAGEPRGALIEQMPFQWWGPRSGRTQATPGESEPSGATKLERGMRVHRRTSRRGLLNPDATLLGGSPANRLALLLEYDNTLRPHKHTGRLRRYDSWLLDGWRHTHFATYPVPPMVVYITAYCGLSGFLIEAADRVLTVRDAHCDEEPREGEYPARERIVFTSRERILRGDWTVQRVPSLPSSLRDKPDVCVPRSLTYDLALQFWGHALPAGVEPGASETADVATALENE